MFRSSLRQGIEQSFSILYLGDLSFLLVKYLTYAKEDS
ncbi:hypothetical protein V441_10970 [Pseudomonas aeruginosa DHS29]|nr:hypothetical protein V441_10970 [Pseudomonas aeruginosa DHS29]